MLFKYEQLTILSIELFISNFFFYFKLNNYLHKMSLNRLKFDHIIPEL
jgi:hypothetical protein